MRIQNLSLPDTSYLTKERQVQRRRLWLGDPNKAISSGDDFYYTNSNNVKLYTASSLFVGQNKLHWTCITYNMGGNVGRSEIFNIVFQIWDTQVSCSVTLKPVKAQIEPPELCRTSPSWIPLQSPVGSINSGRWGRWNTSLGQFLVWIHFSSITPVTTPHYLNMITLQLAEEL